MYVWKAEGFGALRRQSRALSAYCRCGALLPCALLTTLQRRGLLLHLVLQLLLFDLQTLRCLRLNLQRSLRCGFACLGDLLVFLELFNS